MGEAVIVIQIKVVCEKWELVIIWACYIYDTYGSPRKRCPTGNHTWIKREKDRARIVKVEIWDTEYKTYGYWQDHSGKLW